MYKSIHYTFVYYTNFVIPIKLINVIFQYNLDFYEEILKATYYT